MAWAVLSEETATIPSIRIYEDWRRIIAVWLFQRALALLFFLVCVGPATAQDSATGGGAVSIIDLSFHERTIEGQLDACELVYLVAFEDRIYQRGGPVALRGALSLTALRNHPEKDPGVTLKVTAFDLVSDKPQFAPINYAFLSAGAHSFAGQEYGKFTCDDGGFCAAYGFFKTPAIVEALVGGDLSITFNRKPGSSDVRVPIHMSGKAAHANFVFCVNKLLPIILKKIEALPPR